MPDKSSPRLEAVKFGPKRLEKLGKLVDGWIVPDKWTHYNLTKLYIAIKRLQFSIGCLIALIA